MKIGKPLLKVCMFVVMWAVGVSLGTIGILLGSFGIFTVGAISLTVGFGLVGKFMGLMLKPCRVNCEHKMLLGLVCRNDDPTAEPFPYDCPRYGTTETLRCGVLGKSTTSNKPKYPKTSLRTNRFEKYIELMGDKTGRVLDLGCGEGAFADFLGNCHDYHGVDNDAEKVGAAKRKGLDVVRLDLDYGLPFPNGTFDIVVIGEIIEHMPNVSTFLAEIARVLKDNGIIVGSTPNAGNPSRYVLDEFLGKGKDDVYRRHLYIFNRWQLRALFELNGLKVTKLVGVTFLPLSKYTIRLNRWLGRKLPCWSITMAFKAVKGEQE